ncbi:MAG: hypothetical protein KGM44_06575, partial [bacterium]|nr:hypothetical protein [bacterium]
MNGNLAALALAVAAVVLPAAASAGTARSAAPVTLDVRDSEVVDVLRLLAAESGENLVAEASVAHVRISLHLRGVTFERALQTVVRAGGLALHRDGDVIVVGAAETMNRTYGDGGGGLETAVIRLENAHPGEVATGLRAVLPAGTVVMPDARSDSLVIEGERTVVERARRLCTALDVAVVGGGALGEATPIALKYLRPSEVMAQLKGVLPAGSYLA